MLGLLNVKFDHVLNMHSTLVNSRARVSKTVREESILHCPCCHCTSVFFCCVNVKDTHTDTHMVLISQVNRDGASVLLHVHGFRPYFYAAKPPGEAGWGVAMAVF